MENSKTNKELAVETTLEIIKSWNSASNTNAIKPADFPGYLNMVYDAICALDKR